MKDIEILDCTLRDGGRIIDCKFQDNEIIGIGKFLKKSNIDIIELGFLRDNINYCGNSTFFGTVTQANYYAENIGEGNQRYVLFVDYGLYNIENLHSRRHSLESGIDIFKGDFGSVEKPEKLGMDFGAITRIAPVGLYFKEENMQIEEIDVFAANVAASTHGYDAAYISAAILAHIINKVTYTEMTLKEAVSDAMNTVKRLCGYKPHVESVMEGLSRAVSLMSGLPKFLRSRRV